MASNNEATPGGEPAAPSLLRMAGPLVVSFWMRAAFTLVDTVYASLLGDAEVAAIGLTFPFEFFLIAVWVGLSTGLTSCLSRGMGSRQGEKVEQYKRVAWRMVFAVGPAFFVAGLGLWFFGDAFCPDDPELAKAFRIYATVMLSGSALTSFWSIVPDSLIKAHQDTRTTMWASIWSNVLNLALNTLFLFVFQWGVFGIALSTVIGRLGGLVYALVVAARHERRRKESGRDDVEGVDRRPHAAILSLAVPASLSFALMAGESGLINALITRMDQATEALAAYSIYTRILLFMLNPVIALSVAMLPFTALRYGRRRFDEIRAGLRQAGWSAAAYSLAFVLPLVLWLGPRVAAALAESPYTESLTRSMLPWIPVACLLSSPFLYSRPAFEGMNRGTPGLWMSVLRYVFLSGPCALVGAAVASNAGFAPVLGLVWGLLVASAVASVVFLAWVLREIDAAAHDAPTG